MDFGIRGKTALILGGAKGLGWGVAKALAAEGVNLALLSRDHDALETAAERLREQYSVEAYPVIGDLNDWASMAAAIDEAESRLGGQIDILLNNGGGPPPAAISGIAPELWLQQFNAMVLSLIRTADRVVPGMRQRGWGRVLTVGSTSVVEPNPILAMSNTLRSTLVGWSKTLASEVARDGVTVNFLLPGQIATARTEFLDEQAAQRSGETRSQVRQRKEATIPVGRYGTPDEFGAVAAFLASQQAAYLTGSMIRVDGGILRSV
ncbi:SDR family oxidoreductase [Parachitinimonas caeni]|uniref:SDR family oxidoreductase n=1 Tax=Parachitinimonas caeni TaxID=3031301 RepID=A0ABT7E0D6_9NEIS|nr:SDR family oxidoreductase [Parachitinimonas caeni]MDK2125773.1 SDR family oxidoreductase [Parachitinimonas caeni]